MIKILLLHTTQQVEESTAWVQCITYFINI